MIVTSAEEVFSCRVLIFLAEALLNLCDFKQKKLHVFSSTTGFVATDMGLGKTLMMLALIQTKPRLPNK